MTMPLTIPELVKKHGWSRQTVHAKIRAGEYAPYGPPVPNKHGKSSQRYVTTGAETFGKKIPNWRRFELQCRSAGHDPADVLWALLTRCCSKGRRHAPDFYGDPDLLRISIFLTLHAPKNFLGALFGGGGQPCLETEVAGIIKDVPPFEQIDPGIASGKGFKEVWQSAKYFVGAALQDRHWRYNAYPSLQLVDPADPARCRVVMVSRWANTLSEDARGKLIYIDHLYSCWPGEFFGPQRRLARTRAKEFFLRLSDLNHNQGDDMLAVVMAALLQFKGIYFGADGTAGVWTKGQAEAIDWLTERLSVPKKMVEIFAESWGRRYQGLLSCRPDWALVSRIFQGSGNTPIPRVWKNVGGRRKRVPLKKFDWDPKASSPRPRLIRYGEEDPNTACGWPDGIRPGKAEYTQQPDDGLDWELGWHRPYD